MGETHDIALLVLPLSILFECNHEYSYTACSSIPAARPFSFELITLGKTKI